MTDIYINNKGAASEKSPVEELPWLNGKPSPYSVTVQDSPVSDAPMKKVVDKSPDTPEPTETKEPVTKTKGEPVGVPEEEPKPDIDWKSIHTMRKNELQEVCKVVGISEDGLKTELYDRLIAYAEEKGINIF